MQTKITVVDNDEATKDVMVAELFKELENLKDVEVISAGSGNISADRLPRFGVLELLATFVTSAAALQLALAVRDFVKRQSIAIKFTTPDGNEFFLSAESGDPTSVSDIVGFLTKQYTKSSFELYNQQEEEEE